MWWRKGVIKIYSNSLNIIHFVFASIGIMHFNYYCSWNLNFIISTVHMKEKKNDLQKCLKLFIICVLYLLSGPDYWKDMRNMCFPSRILKGPWKSAKQGPPNCIFSQFPLWCQYYVKFFLPISPNI